MPQVKVRLTQGSGHESADILAGDTIPGGSAISLNVDYQQGLMSKHEVLALVAHARLAVIARGWPLVADDDEDLVAPAIISAGTISGTRGNSNTIAGTVATASGVPAPVITYQWQVLDGSWVNVAGATGQNFTDTAATDDLSLRRRVTATNSEGAASDNSNSLVGMDVVEELAGPWLANDITSTTFGSSSHVQQIGDTTPFTITSIMVNTVSSGGSLITNQAVSGNNVADVHANLVAASAPVKAGALIFLAGGNLVSNDDNPFAAADLFRNAQDVVAARPGNNARFLHETTFRAFPNHMAGSGLHREVVMRELERDGRYVVDWQQVARLATEARAYSEWSDVSAPAFSGAESNQVRDLDELPASFKVDATHGNVNWRNLVSPIVHLRWLEAMNNGTPALPFGYRLYSRVNTNVDAGGLVGTIPVTGGMLDDNVTPRTNKWEGCTVTLAAANTDFSIAVEGQDLVVRRVTAGRIANGFTRLWIRVAKTGFTTRVYPIEVILETPPALRTASRYETSADLPDQAVDTAKGDFRTGPWLSRRQWTGDPAFVPTDCFGFTMVCDVEWLGALAAASEQYLFGLGMPSSTANSLTIRIRKTAGRALGFRALDTSGTNYGATEYASTKLFVAGTRALGFISCRIDGTPQIQVGIADSGGTVISTFTPTSALAIRREELAAVTAYSGRPEGGVTGQTLMPTKARFGGLWVSVGSAIDFTVLANRQLFATTESNGTMTLASDSGIVSGITPNIWFPPWFGPGDVWAGRNMGSFGDLVNARRGRLA